MAKKKKHKADRRNYEKQRRAEADRRQRRRESLWTIDYKPPPCFLCKNTMVPFKVCKPIKTAKENIELTLLKCVHCWPKQFPADFKFPEFKKEKPKESKRDYSSYAGKDADGLYSFQRGIFNALDENDYFKLFR